MLSLTPLVFSCKPKANTPHEFQLSKDFELNLIASEPLIEDPVDMEYTRSGQALVLEMPGYPFEQAQSNIKYLLDKNGDKIFDEVKVVAKNLGMATSFLPVSKGILVATPPYLLFLKDENEDLTIEGIDTLMAGFAKENPQHNYNGLRTGIDGWIYAANGGNDGHPYWWGAPETQINLKGKDFRFHLGQKKLEVLGSSSGGFGLGMDAYGRIFETHNLEHISHLVFPERYVKTQALAGVEGQLKRISDHEEGGLARIYPIGEQVDRLNHPEQSGYFSGACGVHVYEGGAFGKNYEHSLWVADVVLNLLHVDHQIPEGSGFKASRIFQKQDILASKDRSFRPVNICEAPDGSLMVMDFYREVIEHPEWIPDEIEKKLDLNAGRGQGRIYQLNLKGNSSKNEFEKLSNAEKSVDLLKSPNRWWRMQAQLALIENLWNPQMVSLLEELVDEKNNLSGLHALWILEQKTALKSKILLKGLNHTDPGIRENALIIAESHMNDPVILKALTQVLNDSNPRVKMQAALSLSTWTQHQKNNLSPDLALALLKQMKTPLDEAQSMAFALAAKSHINQLLPSLMGHKNPNTGLLTHLVFQISLTSEQFNELLENLSKCPWSQEQKMEVLLAAKSSLPPNPDKQKIENALNRLENAKELPLLNAIAELRKELHLPNSNIFNGACDLAQKQIQNNKLEIKARVDYLKLLKNRDFSFKKQALFACLNPQVPQDLQDQALWQLSEIKSEEIGKKLLELWNGMSPQTKRNTSDLLIFREFYHDALLTGLENGIIKVGEMNFDLERRRTLLWWSKDEDIKKRAKKFISDEGIIEDKAQINSMKNALKLAGDGKRGQKIYQTWCASCHKFDSEGVNLGPNLTEISRKSKNTILHSILYPNAEVDPKYIQHLIETKDGQIVAGIVLEENERSLVMGQMGGQRKAILKSDIKKLKSLGSSLMPEGLGQSIKAQEIADLLTFLQKM
jgi:putative membrane-bound dehydrogenase-like protein